MRDMLCQVATSNVRTSSLGTLRHFADHRGTHEVNITKMWRESTRGFDLDLGPASMLDAPLEQLVPPHASDSKRIQDS